VDESGGVLPESESLTSEARDTAIEASATPEVATEPDSSPQLQVGDHDCWARKQSALGEKQTHHNGCNFPHWICFSTPTRAILASPSA
jgi:hypothetical protein